MGFGSGLMGAGTGAVTGAMIGGAPGAAVGGLLGLGAGLFGDSGAGYDPMSFLQDVRSQRPKLNSPWFPNTSVNTPGGGFLGYNPQISVNLQKQNQRLQNALKGKGKNKNLAQNNPGLFNYLKNGGDISNIPSELFNGKNQGLYGLGKKTKTMDFQAQPEPQALAGFNALQELEIQRLKNAQAMQNYTNSMMMPQMMNTFGGVFNNANRILGNGIDELSPGMQKQVNDAVQSYKNLGMDDITKDYTKSGQGLFQQLADSNNFFSSDMVDLGGELQRNKDKAVLDLNDRANLFGLQAGSQKLSDQRNALGTLFGAGQFNNILGGLNQNFNTPYQINPVAINPTGTFSPEFLANNMQYGSQYGLSRDQMIQNAYSNDVNAAMGMAGVQAQLPTASQGFGNILGSLAGTAGGLGIMSHFFPGAYGGQQTKLPNSFNGIMGGGYGFTTI